MLLTYKKSRQGVGGPCVLFKIRDNSTIKEYILIKKPSLARFRLTSKFSTSGERKWLSHQLKHLKTNSTAKPTVSPTLATKNLRHKKYHILFKSNDVFEKNMCTYEDLLLVSILGFEPFSIVEDGGFKSINFQIYRLFPIRIITGRWSSANSESFIAITAYFSDDGFQILTFLSYVALMYC